MIIQVRFGSTQASLGYQFYDDEGTLLGSRVTTGISALPEDGAYVANATVPAGAVGVYWDSSTSEASEDLREALAAITTADIRTELATELARLDVAVSTRSSHTAADVATAVWAAGTRSLTTFGTLVSDISTAVWSAGTRSLTTFGTLVADTTSAVWAAGSRTLTAISDSAGVTTLLSRIGSALTITGGKVTVGTNDDKTGYALAVTPPTAGETATAVRAELATELARIDVAVSSRNATTPPTTSAIAGAVRTELGTELGRIDVAVSTRNAVTPLDFTATQAAAELALIAYNPPTRTEATADKEEIIAAVESGTNGGGGGSTPGEIADAVRVELATELARIDVAVSTRNATTPPDTTAIQAAALAALVSYDPPSRAEATADKNEVLAAVDGVDVPTTEEIADAVCEEPLAGHTTPGTVGAALAAASASGDPWATVVPGAYADGTAGAAVGRLNNTPPDVPVIVVPNPAADSSLTVVYCYTENIANEKRAGIKLSFQLVNTPSKSERVLEVAPKVVLTDAEGYAEVTLQTGLEYRIRARELGLDTTFTPTGDTFDLLTLV